MNKPVLKWSPAAPIRKPDCIVSSQAREKNIVAFTPSYEKEKKCHMNFLLSNEYMKIWYKERSTYEKDIYAKEEIIKEENKIKRRFVQKMMTYRKPTKNFFIEEHLEKRPGNEKYAQDPSKLLQKMKVKPHCIKKKGAKGGEGSQKKESGKDAAPADQKSPKAATKSPKRDQKPEASKETPDDDDAECDEALEAVVVCLKNENEECEEEKE